MSEAEEWNKGVEHPLQSWEWGEFRKLRQPVSRVAGMQVMWTRVPYTQCYFGYVPMGKVPDLKDIEQLKKEGTGHKALGIRIEPQAPKGTMIDGLRPGRPLFKQKTFLLDLTKSEEELLKQMHPKGRYNIKVAQKHGVITEEDNSEEAFNRYLELMFSGTAKRQKIYAHGENYHRQLWASLKNGMAHLWVGKYQGKIIVADIIFEFKNNMYYAFSASALEHKEVMAPTLLLWEIIKWGKTRGDKIFDLWGAEEGKGFTRFKEQFGGKTVELCGPLDLPINKWGYRLFRLVEEARWKILRWKK
jgi:lipid II:glycine glycyltransferase (peptidoglycan interpeptide bridge formation enzyme)